MSDLPSMALIAKVRRGIIFSAPLVLAILGNRKTVTRRLDRSWLKLQVGDLLAMRETIVRGSGRPSYYAADHVGVPRMDAWPWQRDVLPAIHMPHALTRAVLRVTEPQRLERAQDITEDEALREGVEPTTGGILVAGTPYRHAFYGVWDSLHTKPGERWIDNPEVVRIAFESVAGE